MNKVIHRSPVFASSINLRCHIILCHNVQRNAYETAIELVINPAHVERRHVHRFSLNNCGDNETAYACAVASFVERSKYFGAYDYRTPESSLVCSVMDNIETQEARAHG